MTQERASQGGGIDSGVAEPKSVPCTFSGRVDDSGQVKQWDFRGLILNDAGSAAYTARTPMSAGGIAGPPRRRGRNCRLAPPPAPALSDRTGNARQRLTSDRGEPRAS